MDYNEHVTLQLPHNKVVNNSIEDNFIITKNLDEHNIVHSQRTLPVRKYPGGSTQPAPQATPGTSSTSPTSEPLPVRAQPDLDSDTKDVFHRLPIKDFQKFQEYNDFKECIVNIPLTKSLDLDKFNSAVDIIPNKVVAATNLCIENSVNEFIATSINVNTEYFVVCVLPVKHYDNAQLSTPVNDHIHKYVKFSVTSAYAKLNVDNFLLNIQYVLKNYTAYYDLFEYCDDKLFVVYWHHHPLLLDIIGEHY